MSDTTTAVDAWLGGRLVAGQEADIEGAKRRIQERIARNETPPPSTDQFMRGAPPAAPIESSVAQQASQHFAGQQLKYLWGSDFEANLSYAKAAYEKVRLEHPEALARLIEAADGDSSADVALTRLAAQFGRTLDLAAPTYTPAPVYQSTPTRETQIMSDDAAAKRELNRMVNKRQMAQLRGDRNEAEELQAQIDAFRERHWSGTVNVSGHSRDGRGHGERT